MTPGEVEADLAVVGRALADPSRAAMLSALMTGTAWTIGELATQAGVARSTASEHVRHLQSSGLVVVRRQGRHAYVNLAGSDVSQMLESMSFVAPDRPVPAGLRAQRHARELREGRTCYQHLAGRIGVDLHDRFLANQLITPDYVLTPAGAAWFAYRKIGPDVISAARRTMRPCVDWSERRPHLAGPLADCLARHALSQGWVVRGAHPRSARLTAEGARLLCWQLVPDNGKT